MKKIMAIALFLVLVLSLVGCGNNNQFYEDAIWDTNECAGVSVKVEESSSTGITVTLENDTDEDYWISGWSHIQVKIQEGNDKNDAWYEVKIKKDNVSPADDITADDSCVIDWSERYGELPTNYEYRVGIILGASPDTQFPISTWAYFSVK